MNRFSHLVVLLGAKCPGNNHTGAHGKPLEKADHHKDEAARGAYRSQSIVIDEIPDTPSVKGII